ncbi:cold-shock protein [Weissella kandleri]|uniref:cold-shock protein n=1 Tax=Weissella kandleri TaxID=1616 RepID=UPI00387E6111
MEKIKGEVKTWNDQQGFGYISMPGEEDVFVHFSGIQAYEKNLTVGEEVQLVVVPGVRGPQAALVEKLGHDDDRKQ